MLTIIEIKDREDGGHGLQSQEPPGRSAGLEGWAWPTTAGAGADGLGLCGLLRPGHTGRQAGGPDAPGAAAQAGAGAGPDAPVPHSHAVLCATSTAIPDSYALDMSDLFPTWAAVLADGEELPEGRVLNDGGQLYRVVQAVTPQAHQAPHDEGMLAVYRPIDREHAGDGGRPHPLGVRHGLPCGQVLPLQRQGLPGGRGRGYDPLHLAPRHPRHVAVGGSAGIR